jgi:hypothetical protein
MQLSQPQAKKEWLSELYCSIFDLKVYTAKALMDSLLQQVRLPVLVIQPDNLVEHARAESRFFPCWAAKASSQEGDSPQAGSQELELPNTPNKGAYYIEGKSRLAFFTHSE